MVRGKPAWGQQNDRSLPRKEDENNNDSSTKERITERAVTNSPLWVEADFPPLSLNVPNPCASKSENTPKKGNQSRSTPEEKESSKGKGSTKWSELYMLLFLICACSFLFLLFYSNFAFLAFAFRFGVCGLGVWD